LTNNSVGINLAMAPAENHLQRTDWKGNRMSELERLLRLSIAQIEAKKALGKTGRFGKYLKKKNTLLENWRDCQHERDAGNSGL
jgi:hypothetical protein